MSTQGDMEESDSNKHEVLVQMLQKFEIKIDAVAAKLQTMDERLSAVEDALEALPALLRERNGNNVDVYFGNPANSSSTEDPFKKLHSTLLAQGESRPDKLLQIEFCVSPSSPSITTDVSQLTESSIRELFQREPPYPIYDEISHGQLLDDLRCDDLDKQALRTEQVETFMSLLKDLDKKKEKTQRNKILQNVQNEIELFQLMYLADTHATNSAAPAKALSQIEASKKGKHDLFCIAYPQDLELKDVKDDSTSLFALAQSIERVGARADAYGPLLRCTHSFATNGVVCWQVKLTRQWSDPDANMKVVLKDHLTISSCSLEKMLLTWLDNVRGNKAQAFHPHIVVIARALADQLCRGSDEKQLVAAQEEKACRFLSHSKIYMLAHSSAVVYAIAPPPAASIGEGNQAEDDDRHLYQIVVKINQDGTRAARELAILKRIGGHLLQEESLSIYRRQFYIYGAGLYTVSADVFSSTILAERDNILRIRDLPEAAFPQKEPSRLFVHSTSKNFAVALPTGEKCENVCWWNFLNSGSSLTAGTYSCVVMQRGYALWELMSKEVFSFIKELKTRLQQFLSQVLHDANVLHCDIRVFNVLYFRNDSKAIRPLFAEDYVRLLTAQSSVSGLRNSFSAVSLRPVDQQLTVSPASSERREFFENYNVQVIDYDLAQVTGDDQQTDVIVQVGGGQYQMMESILDDNVLRQPGWQISSREVRVRWTKADDGNGIDVAVGTAINLSAIMKNNAKTAK
eukprot:gene28268-34135_t